MRTKTFILYYSTFLFGLQDPFSVLVKLLTGAVCISGMIPNAAGAAACRSEKEALRASDPCRQVLPSQNLKKQLTNAQNSAIIELYNFICKGF